MSRLALAVLAALLVGCGPRLYFNQSFLVSEELRVTKNGYVSLKSTGERFDFSPIRAQEPPAEKIVLLKLHGTYLVTGEGFRHVWRIWPDGDDQARFKPVKLDPGADGFVGPTLEVEGDCALVRWKQGRAFINPDGDVHAQTCRD